MRVLGVDTSCYRTSVALAWADEQFAQKRRLLAVKQGARGLQQSEAVFQHVGSLPDLIERLLKEAPGPIDAVCASCAPRPVAGSYMPVFTVGEGYARALAAALGAPLLHTTHQQGHVRAAMVGADLGGRDFLALHLSGGTTEILRVGANLSIALLGGTSDLNAGQLVDRIGVKLGLPFPAGPALEELAARGEAKSRVPASTKGLICSFSGAEAQLLRLIEGGEIAPEDAACEVYSALARTLAKLIDRACAQEGLCRVLMAGGVAASPLLRRMLAERLRRLDCRAELFWSRPELSGDNAVGAALIGYEEMQRRKANECQDY